MNAWIVPVLASLTTLLVVSIVYISLNLRHKQRMIILEKGLDPDLFKKSDHNTWGRLGSILLGAGFGFLLAFLIDLLVFDQRNGTEPLYPSITTICAGLALLISGRFFTTK